MHGSQDASQLLEENPRYEVIEELGRGAFGTVYRARDHERRADVALKILRERGTSALRELKLEFRARVDLHHENLLQLFEINAEGDIAFMTMELVIDALDCVEFIRGETPPGVLLSGPRQVGRLSTALYSSLSALTCLHEAGFVHRDVKPSNILATRAEDRVRVSDFGLVARAWDPATEAIAGTYGYIAPEVLQGAAPSPESDLFSIGVVALEAMTGEPPHPFGPRDTDLERLTDGPLGELIRGLTRRDAGERIDVKKATELLRNARAEHHLETESLAPLDAIERPVFVGRQEELKRARSVLERTSTEPSVIHVTGPAGIGKTAFVKRLLLLAAPIEAKVHRGRCHPQERLAFRAWDEVAEQLVGSLKRQRVAPDASELELSALARLLPPFAEEFSGEASAESAAAASELRKAGSRGLRAVIAALAARTPLIIWIDDLHWADSDSRDLLADFMESPTPNVTLVLSQRADPNPPRGSAQHSPPIEDSPGWRYMELRLGALDDTEVVALLASTASSVDTISQAARATLARLPMLAADAAALTSADPLRKPEEYVSQLIERRLRAVSIEQSAVLRTVAASPRPLPWSVLEEAVSERESLYASYQALRQAGLLSPVATSAGEAVWTYHELIRAAELETASSDDLGGVHRALAQAYELRSPHDFESIAHHCEQGGRTSDAASNLVHAADRALGNLSFGVAASHYERAFGLSPPLVGRWDLQRKRAECDSSRGLASAAGDRFATAAKLREGSEGPGTALVLRSRAAQELIRCGDTARGYRQLRQAVHQLGIRLPSSHRQTLASSAWLRLRFVLGPKRTRASATPTPAQLERLDALWAGCTALSHVNHSLGDVLLLRHLLLARRVGDPARVMRSLAFEAGAEATIGGSLFSRRSQELLEQARGLCEALDDDYEWWGYWVSRAAVSAFGCDWVATVEAADRADVHLARRQYGVAWERSVNRIYRAIALSMLGRVDALRETVEAGRVDAAERGDDVALNGVTSGHPAILRLFDDEMGTSTTRPVHKPSAQRKWPELAFTSPDYYDTIAEAERRLYGGDGHGGLEVLDAAWPEFKRSALIRLSFVGIDARYLRGRCAIQAASVESDPRARRRLIRVARRERATLDKSAEPLGRPYAVALMAGIAALDDIANANELYSRAAQSFNDVSMRAHSAAAALWAAESRGEEAETAHEESVLTAIGARAPRRIAALLVPGPPTRQSCSTIWA